MKTFDEAMELLGKSSDSPLTPEQLLSACVNAQTYTEKYEGILAEVVGSHKVHIIMVGFLAAAAELSKLPNTPEAITNPLFPMSEAFAHGVMIGIEMEKADAPTK